MSKYSISLSKEDKAHLTVVKNEASTVPKKFDFEEMEVLLLLKDIKKLLYFISQHFI